MSDEFQGPPPIDIRGVSLETSGSAQDLRLSYRGQGTDLFLVVLKNVFLTLVTLGIYAPWARTERRRYLWKQVQIDGQRLEYTGTGKEIFIGLLKVAAVYLVLALAPKIVGKFSAPAGVFVQFAMVVVISILLPYAVYWSRRYLLSRTRWRGIAFGLGGSAGAFAKLWLKGLVLTVVTLGFYSPVFTNQVRGALTRNTQYGNVRFSYDGRDGEAFKISIVGFLLTLLTLGIYFPWYSARMQRFRMAHTHFDRAAGSFDITGGLLFKLMLLNVFGMMLTLGIAFPWIVTYSLRTLLPRMRFEGPVDFTAIMAVPASGNAAADSLAGALGVELGL
ncbi:MAG TPA: DUF898 family protein [Polyangia bacterium]|nr:DUF898 family protein [Polyangia bacterium]